jgi:hypothetical protein
MKELIWEYRYVILVILGAIIYSFLEWGSVKGKILNAIVAAKDLAKDKVLHGGKAQEDWVVSRVYLLLPTRVKLLLSEELLRKIIRYLYQKSMDLLDDGKVNDSFTKDKKESTVINENDIKITDRENLNASSKIEVDNPENIQAIGHEVNPVSATSPSQIN